MPRPATPVPSASTPSGSSRPFRIVGSALLCAALALLVGCSGSGEPAATSTSAPASPAATAATPSSSTTPTSGAAAVTAASAQARAATFSSLVVVGRLETATERAAQKARCSAVGRARDAVAALDPSDQQVAAYQAAVGPALREISTYCTWYVRTIAVAAQQDVVARRLSALLVQRGDSAVYAGRTQRCSRTATCLPGDADKARYLAVLAQNQALTEQSFVLRSGQEIPCPLSDLTAICALTRDVAPKIAQANALVLDRFTALTSFASNPVIERTYTEARAIAGPPNRRLVAAYASVFPGVDTDAPSYTTKNELRLLQGYEKAVAGAAAPTTTPAP